jgi:hypothetical protein
VGDPVEVRSVTYQDRWLSGTVMAVNHPEGRVLCEYSHDSRWIEISGEEICLPNTHFSRELDSISPQVRRMMMMNDKVDAYSTINIIIIIIIITTTNHHCRHHHHHRHH